MSKMSGLVIRFFCGKELKLQTITPVFFESRPNHLKKIFTEITNFIKHDQNTKIYYHDQIYESNNLLLKISHVREMNAATGYVCTQLDNETGVGVISTPVFVADKSFLESESEPYNYKINEVLCKTIIGESIESIKKDATMLREKWCLFQDTKVIIKNL